MFNKGDKKRFVREPRQARESFGLNLKELKEWKTGTIQKDSIAEYFQQEAAVSRVRAYLDSVGMFLFFFF